MVLRFLIKFSVIIASLVAFSTNFYIYTYPSVHPQSCYWSCDKQGIHLEPRTGSSNIEKALLYSFRYIKDVTLNTLTRGTDTRNENEVRLLAFGDPQIKGNSASTPYRTRLDTFGNDYYLGHIYDTMYRRLKPTHVAVLGDLLSSQWIDDSEFFNRTSRYMSRIFKRDQSILDRIKYESHDENGQYCVNSSKWIQEYNEFLMKADMEEGPDLMNLEFGYHDVYTWGDNANDDTNDYLFINTTGNHDIGYSGDTTYEHLARYTEMFGKDNYWIEYNSNKDNAWRIVVLNSMLLEGPANEPELLTRTWKFLYSLYERKFSGSTVLITHVPFYKPKGLCTDGPMFRYYDDNTLSSQNHLSEATTNEVLDLIFDNGKSGIILTGHDHFGCETYYTRNATTESWVSSNNLLQQFDFHIKEITVKSMMGQYKGNTGVITGQFNETNKSWNWSYTLCPFTNEHAWWIAKGSAIVWVLLFSLYILY